MRSSRLFPILILLSVLAAVPGSSAENGGRQGNNWEAFYRAQLDRKITFEFVDTPVVETVNMLSNLISMNVIVDPNAVANYDEGGPGINLKVRNAPLGNTLKTLLQQAGLDFEIRDEAFFIFKTGMYSQKTEGTPVALGDEQKKTLDKALIDLNSDRYEVREDASRTILGLGLVCAPALEKLARTTADAEAFLRVQKILAAFDAKVFQSESPDVTRALNAMEQKISFEFEAAPAREAVQFVFSKQLGDFHFDDLGTTPISLRVNKMSLGNAIRWLARMSNARLILENNVVTLKRGEGGLSGGESVLTPRIKKRFGLPPEE